MEKAKRTTKVNIVLHQQKNIKPETIMLPGSKSESNRLLILQAQYPNLSIKNLSNSDDTVVMQRALSANQDIIDIHHAGTAMRFLTAYFAIKHNSEVILTGSTRMKQRPIGILVEALRYLGANIKYIENEGFPPLKIKGTPLKKSIVTIQANTSSQFISALMLIAPSLPNGLTIKLEGKTTSIPYIKMTQQYLRAIGVKSMFNNTTIQIEALQNVAPLTLVVESDWSAASYYYSIVALAPNAVVTLKNFKKNSTQGDSALVKIYQQLGVHTQFNDVTQELKLTKTQQVLPSILQLNLQDTPDIAQTIAVTCFGLGISCELTGLHTLKIKETDRLVALKTEIEKLGGKVIITKDSLHLEASKKINKNMAIATYNDHRMAMAFAPLALKTTLIIKDAEVVTKSYPQFWEHIENLGIQISLLEN